MPATPHSLDSPAPPKQARSHATLQRILDAAEALIEEKGLADASIPEIVRQARSSVGGFYARFRDKDDLLRGLEARFLAEMADRVDALADEARWVDASLHAIVDACATELVSVIGERRNLIAAFLTRAALDPEVRADALRFRALVSERITQLLMTRRDAFDHPEPDLAIDLAVQFAFGLTLQRVVSGRIRAAGRPLSDADVIREIVRNFTRYVGATDIANPPATRKRS
jgi:AcrR family transcriptional regulator